VQTDEWRQATLAKVPIRIPVGSVTQVSQVETRGEAGVAFAVFVIALIAIGLSTGGPWIGD
jgi:hypothetical protein